MATYSLFGQPATPPDLTSTGTGDVSGHTFGCQFKVSQPCALTGIWWYSGATCTVLPSACVIINADASSQVSGTLNSSPSWSGAAGSGWVKCSYNGSVTLLPGINYEIGVFANSTSKWYTFSQNYWARSGTLPGADGIGSGLLFAPGDTYSLNGQGPYLTGSAIATGTLTSTSSASNWWADVEVTTTTASVPVYSLWSQQGGGTLAADTANYTLATQFAVAYPTVLTGIWFYSPSGAASLPSACCIYDLRTRQQIPGSLNNSPSWVNTTGAAASPGDGWVKCSYPGTVQLGWAAYVAAVLGGGSNWYSTTSGYFTTNIGVYNGPLSAEQHQYATTGQGLKNAGSSLVFPATDGSQVNYWVDAEVSDIAGLPAQNTLNTKLTLPPDPSTNDATNAATFGIQFTVSATCRADAIWQLNSGNFPTQAGLFQITGVGTGTLLASVANPAVVGAGTWSWCRIPIPPVILHSGTNYEVCSYRGDGAAWMPTQGGYWTTGPATAGLANGLLSAPNSAGAVNGQACVSSTNAFTFPDTTYGSGTNACLDIEVAQVTQSSPLVQGGTGTAAAANITVTLPAATTAGNCLVACVAVVSGSAGSAVTGITLGPSGSADNWASLAATGNLTTDAGILAIWADPNCAGGQTSVTISTNVSGSPGQVACAYVYEFSYLQSTVGALLDQSATVNTHGSTTAAPSAGPTGTTTQAAEVLVGCMLGYNTTVTGPGLPWRNQSQLTQGNNRFMAGYQVVNTTGTAAYAPLFSSTTFAEGAVVTLRMATQSVPGPPVTSRPSASRAVTVPVRIG